MILPFKQYFPWHTEKNPAPTFFREKILAGVGYLTTKEIAERLKIDYGVITHPESIYTPKLHTIRAGNRWKAGDKIHMAYGSRTKNYQQFNKGIPELERVKSTESISVKYLKGLLLPSVAINGHILTDSEIDTLAINDGFEGINDFFNWFNVDFQGQIIHFTDLRYY